MIKVLVQDAAGKPVPGAEVRLIPAKDDGSPNTALTPVSLKSDKKGKATFGFVRPGRYVMTTASEGMAFVAVSMKMRDQNNKVPLLPDGTRIEDSGGSVPFEKQEIQVSFPSKVFSVEIVATMGQPVASTPRVEAPASVAPEQEALRLASAHMTAGRFEDGIAAVDKALAENPGLIEETSAAIAVNYLKGYGLANLERPKEAEPFIREAVRLSPDLPGGNRLLARTLLAQGKWTEAVDALDLALASAGDAADQRGRLLYLKGQALIELKNGSASVAALEEAHSLLPGDQDVLIQYVNALTVANRSADADQVMADANLPPREGAALHYNLAVALMDSSNFDSAVNHLNKSLELNPGMADAYKLLGQCYLALGKNADAIKSFEAYLAGAPNADDASTIKQVINAVKTKK
ncbi:MAG: tetratricopeptide repeat protein [Acidobacteriota bacterium]